MAEEEDFVRGPAKATKSGPHSKKRDAPTGDFLFSSKDDGKKDKSKKKKKKKAKKEEDKEEEDDPELQEVMRHLERIPKRIEPLTFSKLEEDHLVLGVVTEVRKNALRVVRSGLGGCEVQQWYSVEREVWRRRTETGQDRPRRALS